MHVDSRWHSPGCDDARSVARPWPSGPRVTNTAVGNAGHSPPAQTDGLDLVEHEGKLRGRLRTRLRMCRGHSRTKHRAKRGAANLAHRCWGGWPTRDARASLSSGSVRLLARGGRAARPALRARVLAIVAPMHLCEQAVAAVLLHMVEAIKGAHVRARRVHRRSLHATFACAGRAAHHARASFNPFHSKRSRRPRNKAYFF